jgi:hypothetical protein
VLYILLAMVVIIAVAVLVVVYVAYPHRGEEVPNAPWVGEALKRTVDAVPTIEGEGDKPSNEHNDDVLKDEQDDTDGDKERL